MPRIGWHCTWDRFEAAGRPDILDEAREKAFGAIAGHQPMPFADGVAEELDADRRGGRRGDRRPPKRGLVMRLDGPYLTQAEIERVHEASLAILADTGVRVHGEVALPLLADAGARVDREAGIARIPRELVERALALAPRAFTLGARNPALDFPVPSAVARLRHRRHRGVRARLRDRRAALRDEGRHHGRDARAPGLRPRGDGLAAGGRQRRARRVAPAPRVRRHGRRATRATASTSCIAASRRRTSPRCWPRSPGPRRPSGSATRRRSSTAPSRHSSTTDPMLDAYLELGGLDVPIMVLPMPVPGTTGPASLLGNIALANAEALSSIVAFEIAHPGRPIVYGSAVGSMDFRSGGFLAGTPEMGIQSAALTTMGKFYGLPTAAAGLRVRRPRARARGRDREAAHDDPVHRVGRRHHRRLRRDRRRPDADPGADPRGQRARPPRRAAGRRRRRARGRRAARRRRRGGPRRPLPRPAGDPAGGPQRRVLRARR